MTTTPNSPDIIILRYGEISLKTPYVRTAFESRLITNIRKALQTQNIQATITRERGRIYLHTTPTPETLTILSHISGLVSFSPAQQTTADLPTLTTTTVALARPHLTKETSFALRVTRTGRHPYTSQDAARTLGAAIQATTHAPVNLTHPTTELFIEIRSTKTYLFTDKHRGIGGLPVGTQGKIAVLLDTPASLLAAWYLMHRGCSLHLIATQPTDQDKINDFLTTWHLQSPTTLLDATSPDFTDHLRRHTAIHRLDAIATGATRDDPTKTLEWLTRLKAQVHLPLLTPVIALTTDEARHQAKEKGVPL